MSFWHASRDEKHGIRAWWHFGQRNVAHVTVVWWTHFCHAGIEVDDEKWQVSLALPPLAIWVSLSESWLWKPQRRTTFYWETPPREVWLTDQRKCEISIHDWTIWIAPWSKTMEWAKTDPWWVRGVSLDLKRLVLGRQRCDCETLTSGIPVVIPMPEGVYHGTATIERRTWSRPRWFSFSRVSTQIECPKGIPHAGKGENSWDCGDDGLFGWGAEGESIEHAIAHGVEVVLTSRRRYGHASAEAIQKALG